MHFFISWSIVHNYYRNDNDIIFFALTNIDVLLLDADPNEGVEVVDELLLDDAPRDVAVVTVPSLVKEDVTVRVV